MKRALYQENSLLALLENDAQSAEPQRKRVKSSSSSTDTALSSLHSLALLASRINSFPPFLALEFSSPLATIPTLIPYEGAENDCQSENSEHEEDKKTIEKEPYTSVSMQGTAMKRDWVGVSRPLSLRPRLPTGVCQPLALPPRLPNVPAGYKFTC